MTETNLRKNKNESGQVMVEFLFATIVSFGLFMLFLALVFTFSAVEVTQYAAFAVARAQLGSHKSAEDQKSAAIAKYKALLKNPALGVFFQSGWFVLGKKPDIKQGNDPSGTFERLISSGVTYEYSKSFTGVSIPFESKILSYKVLFIDNGGDKEGGGFKTNVNAVLIRENSQAECYEFWKNRGSALKGLPSGNPMDVSKYYPMEDNGC